MLVGIKSLGTGSPRRRYLHLRPDGNGSYSPYSGCDIAEDCPPPLCHSRLTQQSHTVLLLACNLTQHINALIEFVHVHYGERRVPGGKTKCWDTLHKWASTHLENCFYHFIRTTVGASTQNIIVVFSWKWCFESHDSFWSISVLRFLYSLYTVPICSHLPVLPQGRVDQGATDDSRHFWLCCLETTLVIYERKPLTGQELISCFCSCDVGGYDAIQTLKRVTSREASGTLFVVCGMTLPGIEGHRAAVVMWPHVNKYAWPDRWWQFFTDRFDWPILIFTFEIFTV